MLGTMLGGKKEERIILRKIIFPLILCFSKRKKRKIFSRTIVARKRSYIVIIVNFIRNV